MIAILVGSGCASFCQVPSKQITKRFMETTRTPEGFSLATRRARGQ
jgi:hypothetical protein